MTPAAPLFLLVDDNRDRRALLMRTLRRKFPSAVVRECAEAETALACVREGSPDAIVLHRAGDIEGSALLAAIRKQDPAVPLVFLSVGALAREVVEAGGSATRFLNYEAWLTLGTVLEELFGATPSRKKEGALA